MDTLNDDPHDIYQLNSVFRCNGHSQKTDSEVTWPSSAKDQVDPALGVHVSGGRATFASLLGNRLARKVKKIAVAIFVVLGSLPLHESLGAQVTLSWDSVEDANLTGYHVYARRNDEGYGSMPAWAGNTPTCFVDNLVDNTSYCFIVRALDGNGRESGNSNEACYLITADNTKLVDTDGDGMPDDWEFQVGLDPNVDDSQQDPDGDSISNLDEYEHGSDPWVTDPTLPPQQPEGNQPIDDSVVASVTPNLETGEFFDSDSDDTHYQSQWRIVRIFDNLCVFNSRSKLYLTKFKVPNWILESETQYYWQVRFFDNHGAASEWSSQNFFETPIDMRDRDGNGILDDQEVDDNQDLNGDGILDLAQPDTIKCVTSGYSNGILGVGLNQPQGNTLLSGMSSGDLDEQVRSLNKPVQLPYGVFEYRIDGLEPGGTVQVQIFLPSPADAGSKLYQMGIESEWIDFSEHAQFNTDRKTVTLQLKDGGYGDIDGIENSVIVDRSGLVLTNQSSDNSSSAPLNWGGSGSCFINVTHQSNDVERFYIWLALAGIVMMVLSKLFAIWHEKYHRTKKVQ